MEHFVTLFDSFFLPQGIALHRSMERKITDYTLWVLCVDDVCHQVLSGLTLPNVRLLRLGELETEALRKVKSERTTGEYCWTLTPFAPRWVFEADASVRRVTYLDADLWFRRSPAAILTELDESGKSVLITEHAYAAEHDFSAEAGIFCVQFLTFVRDSGEVTRKWWEDRCIEWCFARLEDGKFGDQKYLDDWPERFPAQVHVLRDQGLALAPWNAARFPYGRSVFFHFHGLRIESNARVEIGHYTLPRQVLENVYRPYLQDLREAVMLLELKGFVPRRQLPVRSWFGAARLWMRRSLEAIRMRIVGVRYVSSSLKY